MLTSSYGREEIQVAYDLVSRLVTSATTDSVETSEESHLRIAAITRRNKIPLKVREQMFNYADSMKSKVSKTLILGYCCSDCSYIECIQSFKIHS